MTRIVSVSERRPLFARAADGHAARATVMDHARALPAVLVLEAVATGCGPTATSPECYAGALDVVSVRTRTDIAALPRVETINELWISESELEDLTGFECLRSAGKVIIERNAGLRSLEGLASLEEVVREGVVVQGQLWVRDNPALESLAGLDSLDLVDGEFDILRNSALVHLDGPAELRLVNGGLEIGDNPSLVSVGGFEAFEGGDRAGDFGGGFLVVQDNPLLTDVVLPKGVLLVHGLQVNRNPRLTHLGFQVAFTPRYYEFSDNASLLQLPESTSAGTCSDSLLCDGDRADTYTISNNDEIVTLAPLRHLRGIGELVIRENGGLTDLGGLEGIADAFSLTIDSNPALQTLAAVDPSHDGSLSNLHTQLNIRDNAALSPCDVESFAAELLEGNPELEVDVSGNQGSCR